MLEQHEEIGEARGEERLEKLLKLLIEENRLDDMKRAIDNRDYRESLYLLYKLK